MNRGSTTEIVDPLVGKVIGGYKFLEMLGRGGMGIVYKAHDVNLDRFVAMKTLIPELASDPVLLDHFVREARTLARLRDDNIISVHNIADLEPHGKFIVMEFVEGETLADRIRREGGIPWSEALPLFKQFLSALANSHEAGIIHRDIKPANVMITFNNVVKVADFGLAKILQDADQTKTQGIAGTLKYMAPEQKEGLAYTDERSDIYSAGMTLYEALAGRTPLEVAEGKYSGEMPTVRKANASVPSEFSGIIMKALQRDPNRRYQKARQMLKDLEVFENRYKADRKHTNKRTSVIAAVVAVLILCGALAGYLLVPKGNVMSITTIPTGALVSIGEDEIGSTPIRNYRIPNRPINVRLALDGYEPLDTMVTPEPGRPLQLANIPLQRVPASTLTIVTDPGGARVSIEGDSVGVTPFADVPIAGAAIRNGQARLRIERTGYAPVDTVVRVAAGGNVALDLHLSGATQLPPERIEPVDNREIPENRPANGMLFLRAQPRGAMFVNNRSAQPGEITLPVGKHTVACGSGEYRSQTSVTVRAGQTLGIDCFFESTVNVNTAWDEQRTAPAPAASIRINDRTVGASPWSQAYAPGTYRIEATFLQGQSYEVTGGQYTVRTSDGKTKSSTRFSGSSFALSVKPTFENERHLVSFRIREKESSSGSSYRY